MFGMIQRRYHGNAEKKINFHEENLEIEFN